MKKIENTDHPNNGHSGYLMPANEYALVSLREYDKPADVAEYFDIPSWARTDTAQKSKEIKWDIMKGKHDTFCNICTVLTSVLEDDVEDAYHSGGTGLGDLGFRALDPPPSSPSYNGCTANLATKT